MKTRFNTYDIVCAVTELQKLVGMRVNQIYDIDNKTYLIRLQGTEVKTMLIMESGIRFHSTAFEWPKNMAPSGFSMKLRKHLKNKRLEKLQQLGADRIVDFQFGVGEAAYHIILELYDRGNIILTDHELTILYILRPHYEGEEVRFAVREKYPTNRAKEASNLPTEEELREALNQTPYGENLRRVLMPLVDCGPAVIDHILVKHKLDNCVVNFNKNEDGDGATEQLEGSKKGRKQKKKEMSKVATRPFEMDTDIPTLMEALKDMYKLLSDGRTDTSKGYIIQKAEEKPSSDAANVEHFYQNIEYHPYLFAQYEGQPMASFNTFMLAVDEFYSKMEGQKIDLKTLQQEREALKKLSNVKKDHAKRLEELTKVQEVDKQKAELITNNQSLVDNAILAIRSSLARQMSWQDIHELVKAAQANGDPVASAIKQLKLEVNHISLTLSDPYQTAENDSDSESEAVGSTQSLVVDVDLALSAWANARKYYDQKRNAAQKEQKTIDASEKALKNAERKTQQTLKDVRTISTISKVRKVYWFEKFYWFISSENYLVIGGRDAQQNELIVKRYMRSSDIYVHAEIQGASSVVIRNNSSTTTVPPKTLLEAGTMAICYSVAWDAKVVTNAYWVHSDQVSKTAPTGEYLGTGSFMIRGKKNFLPSCHLIMGLSLLFKLEDSFIEKHRGDRKVRSFEDENQIDMEEHLKQLAIENEEENRNASNIEIELENDENAQVKEETSDSESEVNFPDTEVKIEHDTGKITVRSESITESNNDAELKIVTENLLSAIEEATIIPAAPSRRKLQQNSKKRKEEKARKTQNELQLQQQNSVENQSKNPSHMKRGQKGKLKKIKAKYKDQDDEERELRMQILKSSGKEKVAALEQKLVQNVVTLKPKQPHHNVEQKVAVDIDESEEVSGGVDTEILDSLTGVPADEDELLFAVPVVAPYQALQNYKYKVKLTPGTGKRGRAAKTSLTMFSKEKSCTIREKDLLKSIREEALARNIPGKVKLSAPQLQKFKK
ncbi:nuclear export mediator factor NEMF homolog [Teleopsis dalmanni]|uniref:nuclear export mediator factor NEMF homolog n=1 Tax=Teleopsis dalmanni TaxID=139649 RepID=UPI0018CF3EAE|nr:nuclear export mediator factor NEMF homolog [Teleopsis dalmanni]